ncbi:MAG: insulinase family protein [Bacteroidales bacterium]
MNFRQLTIIMAGFVFASIFLGSCQSEEYKVGSTYHGFKLKKKEFIEEVNSDCYYFEHMKSGARLLKIANDDVNKTFSASFKTLPNSDCGTPHILEHSVLNGSKNFPVKSPFTVLTKGSLNTFLNAMTSSDMTSYPVASMNDKDFRNLMHVYLDAVFFPKIYENPKIFRQEGWHYELESKDAPVVYKGVVYNEMKGAFSDPSRVLNYHISKNLFPDNTYGNSSGGYPEKIPELTYEKFKNFHETFYHPTNSYLYLYGDSDLDKDLAFINEEYLSNFEKLDKRAKIAHQEPFDEMKDIVEYYPVGRNDKTEDKTFLTMSWVIGEGADQEMEMLMKILSDALVNHESGPLKLALQDADIGRDINAYYSANKQGVFHLNIKNANLSDKDKFHKIVTKKLEEIAEEEIDEDILKGIINKYEFNLRESDNPQKGLTYLFRASNGWLYAEDPFLSLKWEEPLAATKKDIENNKLERIIENEILDNPHSLLIALAPKPGLQAERDQKIADKLEEYKSSRSEEQMDSLIEETEELIAYQKKENSPEDLAKMPLLELEEIDKEAEYFDIEEKDISGIKELYYNTFTNNILYSKFMFDARVLTKEQIPYMRMLSTVLGDLNTENYSFGELNNALNTHLGGFSTSYRTDLKNHDDENLLANFVVQSKVLNENVDKLFELSDEVLHNSKIDDKKRLKTLLTKHLSKLEANNRQNGLGLASTRLSSYFSNQGKFNELTQGYTYYEFVSNLMEDYDENYDEIVENLQTVAELLFNKNNMIAFVTCGEEDMSEYDDHLKDFVQHFPDTETDLNEWEFDFANKNEGMLAPSKVQYVTKGYNFKKLGYEYDGKIRVLNQILSREWLNNQIRVIGGAYGGFSQFSESGNFHFASYRDPNLKKTVENIDGSSDFLREFSPSESKMRRFVIGTISNMDRPRSPSQEGNTALRYYMTNTTKEDLQSIREDVLSTTAEDIREMADFVDKILSESTLCVYGNEDKLNSQNQLFDNLFSL